MCEIEAHTLTSIQEVIDMPHPVTVSLIDVQMLPMVSGYAVSGSLESPELKIRFFSVAPPEE